MHKNKEKSNMNRRLNKTQVKYISNVCLYITMVIFMDLCISDVVADYVTIMLSFLDNHTKKPGFIYVAVV